MQCVVMKDKVYVTLSKHGHLEYHANNLATVPGPDVASYKQISIDY
jgi:hypothetical protein